MENIIKLLISGYVVGLACMAYLLLRSCAVQLGVGTGGQVIAIEKAGTTNWFAIALFSMGVSYAWCFLGALIYSMIDSATGFVQFSLLFAILSSIAIYATAPERKLDKIAVNSIVVVGCGVMLANLF